MEIVVMKVAGNFLVPVDSDSIEYVSKFKLGAGFKIKITSFRNYLFLQKFFCLVNYAFDIWEPTEFRHCGNIVKKEREQFRSNLIIYAGFYNSSIGIDNELVLTAQSISFASMNQETFDRLYSAVFDVILEKILCDYSNDELENIVNNLMSFL